MSKRLLFASLLLSFVGLASCSNDKDDKKNPELMDPSARALPSSQALTIVNGAGKPIEGARVLIGTELGKPFAGNYKATDTNGQIALPADWTDEQPITIDSPGYIRVTYFGQKPEGRVFKLRVNDGMGNFELTGVTTGFQIADRDGLVDFAAVVPAFDRQDLFSFDLSMVISRRVDRIRVLGQDVSLPSNISLPRQNENYIFPVTLEKPIYRMYFRERGARKVVTLRGRFPLKQVVDEIRGGKDFLSLINLFDIQGGSMKTPYLSGASTQADLPVNEMNFAQSRRMTAPDFRNTEMVIAAPMNQRDGYLYPSDVKSLTPRQSQTLRLGNQANPLLLTVAKRKAEMEEKNLNGRLSAALLPFSSGLMPSLIPLMENPRLLSRTTVQVPAVRAPSSVTPTATYATLWQVHEKMIDNQKVEVLQTQWEVYAPDWVSSFSLPLWPKVAPMAGKMRWGVTLVGQSSKVAKEADLGPDLLDITTHATHSAVDF